MNQKQIFALNCLLAEQVEPLERLLWRSCPNLERSSAARARKVLARSPLYTMALGSLVIIVLFLAIAILSAVPQDVLGVLIVSCIVVLMYIIFKRPRWLRRLRESTSGSITDFAFSQRETAVVEPPPVPALRGKYIYGLTDQRVIILEVGKRRSVRSLWLSDLEEVQCIDAGDGWGDLILVGAMRDTSTVSPWIEVSPVQRQRTRLWGIERVRCVEEALRALLTHKPLKAAIDALNFPSDNPPGQTDVLSSASKVRDQQWQVPVWYWYSDSSQGPKKVVIYGSNLAQLRMRVTATLLRLRPDFFCNTFYPPTDEHIGAQRQYGFYSCSKQTSSSRSSQSVSAASMFPTENLEDSGEGARKKNRYMKKSAKTNNAFAEMQESTDEAQGLHPQEEPIAQTQKSQEEQPCQWTREALIPATSSSGSMRFLLFPRFEDAVAHFVTNDILVERGPTYIDEFLFQEQQLRHAQTVKVVDDDFVANDLLHRGGWHVLHVMGMTAPRGQIGPVLFVLGHPEDGAK